MASVVTFLFTKPRVLLAFAATFSTCLFQVGSEDSSTPRYAAESTVLSAWPDFRDFNKHGVSQYARTCWDHIGHSLSVYNATLTWLASYGTSQ